MIHDKSFAGSRALFIYFFFFPPRLSARKKEKKKIRTTAEPLRSQRLRCAGGMRSHGAAGVAPHRTAQRAAGSAPPGPPDRPGLSDGMGRPSRGGGLGPGARCAERGVPAVGAAMGFIPFQLVIDSLEHHRGYFIESIQSRLFIRSRYYSKGTISWKKKNLPNLEGK